MVPQILSEVPLYKAKLWYWQCQPDLGWALHYSIDVRIACNAKM